MKQIYLLVVCITAIGNLKADVLGDIKKGFKKATKETSKGLKTAATETQKGLEKANQETAKGLITATKQADTQLKMGGKTIVPGLELAGQETLKGLETAGKETGQFFVDFGKSEIAPFVEPGKELKAFKDKKLEGAGKGKTINKGDTATWRIGTGCIVAVKAWLVEELKTTARDFEKMTAEQKKDTDVEIVINDYILDQMKAGIYQNKNPKKVWQEALEKNQSFTYRRYVGDWTVYEVTASDNQCINHDFRVDYDSKTKKLNIKKTK